MDNLQKLLISSSSKFSNYFFLIFCSFLLKIFFLFSFSFSSCRIVKFFYSFFSFPSNHSHVFFMLWFLLLFHFIFLIQICFSISLFSSALFFFSIVASFFFFFSWCFFLFFKPTCKKNQSFSIFNLLSASSSFSLFKQIKNLKKRNLICHSVRWSFFLSYFVSVNSSKEEFFWGSNFIPLAFFSFFLFLFHLNHLPAVLKRFVVQTLTSETLFPSNKISQAELLNHF